MLTLEENSETALFGEFSNQVFESLQFQKYISYDDLLFPKNIESWMKISEMEQKMERNFLVFKIIAFKQGMANYHNPEQDICHQQSTC